MYNKAHDFYQINDIFERHKNITPDYKLKACIILRTVSNCLQNIIEENRNCSYDMYLVSINGLTKKRMNNFTCSKKGVMFDPKQIQTQTSLEENCQYDRERSPRVYCSFYSSSHLRNFKGLPSMCKSTGSFSLVDNEFLNVVGTSATIDGVAVLRKVSEYFFIFFVNVIQSKRCHSLLVNFLL